MSKKTTVATRVAKSIAAITALVAVAKSVTVLKSRRTQKALTQ